MPSVWPVIVATAASGALLLSGCDKPRPGADADDDDEKKTQDFMFIAHDAIFAGNVQHFHDFFGASVAGGGSVPENLPIVWHLLTHPHGTPNRLRGRKVCPGIADIRWFSAAPFKLGETDVKYVALPCEQTQFHPPTADRTSDDYLKFRLRDQLDPDHGTGICLTFDIRPRASNSLPMGGINRARRDVMYAFRKRHLKKNGFQRFKPTGGGSFYPGAKFPWLTPPPSGN